MADTNIQNSGGGGGGAMAALAALLIVVLVAFGIYFAFFRGDTGGPGDTNIDINATVPAGSGLPGGPAE